MILPVAQDDDGAVARAELPESVKQREAEFRGVGRRGPIRYRVTISGAPPGSVPQTCVKSDASELWHASIFSDLLYRKIRIIPSPAAPSR